MRRHATCRFSVAPTDTIYALGTWDSPSSLTYCYLWVLFALGFLGFFSGHPQFCKKEMLSDSWQQQHTLFLAKQKSGWFCQNRNGSMKSKDSRTPLLKKKNQPTKQNPTTNKKPNKNPTHNTKNLKEKELYIILGNESTLCRFDFLTRQSGICRQMTPDTGNHSAHATELPPHQKSWKVNKPQSSSTKPLLFLCESWPSYTSHGQNKASLRAKVYFGVENDRGPGDALHPHFSSAMAVIFP